MSEIRDVIVIGGGPAGLAAAIAASRGGLDVELVEQRQTTGGAIYRKAIAGVTPVAIPLSAHRRRDRLFADFHAAKIAMRTSGVFLGVDARGHVLVEDRNTGMVVPLKCRAVIIATGAIENILPRPGWELPGVATAGGIQVMMKETARPPQGRVLLAGNGPLLIAVAAQMARLGNPPVAIVEAGNPLRRWPDSMAMLRYPELLADAAGYLKTIYLSRTPWLRGHVLTHIAQGSDGLVASVTRPDGRTFTITADHIGLHDGIRPNNAGLPSASTAGPERPLILHSGDCREALGAVAAEADGRRAGLEAVKFLSRNDTISAVTHRDIEHLRNAQTLLARVFAPVNGSRPLCDLPDETVLCRCEGRTVGDLKAMMQRADTLSGREVKHNGRFGMGACQGRFCALHTTRLMNELRPDNSIHQTGDITGQRWPLRPVTIAALTAAEQNSRD